MYNFNSITCSSKVGVSPFLEKIVVKETDFQTVLVFKGLLTGMFGLIIFIMNAKHFLKIKISIIYKTKESSIIDIIFNFCYIFIYYW